MSSVINYNVSDTAKHGNLVRTSVHDIIERKADLARVKSYMDALASGTPIDWQSVADAFGIVDAATAEQFYNLVVGMKVTLDTINGLERLDKGW